MSLSEDMWIFIIKSCFSGSLLWFEFLFHLIFNKENHFNRQILANVLFTWECAVFVRIKAVWENFTPGFRYNLYLFFAV